LTANKTYRSHLASEVITVAAMRRTQTSGVEADRLLLEQIGTTALSGLT
jgi:hypothetical protein